MASYNRVILIGNMTRDPELRYLQSGTAVCEIGLAVNERRKKGNQYEDVPNFFDVTFFQKQAELVSEYTQKGSQILVEGRLQQDRWEDNQGQKRSKVKITADRLEFLGKRGEREDRGDDTNQDAPAPTAAADSTDDIPW